ncbi:MAG: hypothetical protein EOO53_16000 [Gammaproteobacteria bacterium]|nr:MAG: hypothetical protein EOO53_16000 [Gammaproteobacteria bacterium]
MQESHRIALNNYDTLRNEARAIASQELPNYLRRAAKLKGIDAGALSAARLWDDDPERLVSWDWNFASRYIHRYPKAFDLAIWVGNKLCTLALGRPSYNGTFMRLDFIEKAPTNCPFSSEMVPISILAYETYAKRIGAKQFRIIDPINDKVLRSYLQHGGFSHHRGLKGNPHYLVREL